ncbi:hypothetical protein [Polaribacter sp. OB-PA-B3]
MEKRYEITEKQLVFLEDFLLRKYPGISNETKIELIDHLVSDFEATTENGNLSQYLSNELEFIARFVFKGVSLMKKTYRKETWEQFFKFFTEPKLLLISISTLLFFYFLNETVTDKIVYLVTIILSTLIFGYSVFKGMIKNKELKNLDEVKFLGNEIWLPFTLVQLLGITNLCYSIMKYSWLYTLVALFIIIYGLSALMVILKHKKIILEKYKHLLN